MAATDFGDVRKNEFGLAFLDAKERCNARTRHSPETLASSPSEKSLSTSDSSEQYVIAMDDEAFWVTARNAEVEAEDEDVVVLIEVVVGGVEISER
ncbi:hypothetical protein LENED_008210 [Lentinula edodes]|uniref:Uncharacterized protein n=1 Tax=Lentinula edodes TaxID=5353 RepID=A0A1Q3EGI7_LENED|nr:hypothetical protein LENED_008210 [Lentinula edodes]